MKKVISILRFTAGVFIASILAIVISDSMNVNCSISYGPSILFSGVATFVYRMTNMGLFFTTFSTVTGVVLGVVLAYMGAGHIVGVWDRLFEGKKVQSQNDLGKG